MRTRIKICGITNIEDAMAACEYGADAIGFIFADSPRMVAPETAAQISLRLPPFVKRVGVFVDSLPLVADVAATARLDLIQLHGDQPDTFASDLGSWRVIRVVRVKDQFSLDLARNYTNCAAYLLDTWKSAQKGGTGETFDWDLAQKAKELGRPVILAGGLNAENVYDAVTRVRPYAVDVSSGVEACPGKKNLALIKEFIDNVRRADANA